MPLLLHSTQKATTKRTAGLVKAMPKTNNELAAQSLSSLWGRLLQSYVHFTQPGCDPFVTQAEDDSAERQREQQWAAGFGSTSTATTAALIEHLFLSNEHFDAVAWLITFCLIDRLQLHHYVHQRLQHFSFWKLPDASTAAVTSFRLVKQRVVQLLFTTYCLAFKWHLDYTVSVKYLTNLLPHASLTRRAILRRTIAEELAVFQMLDYNCAVSAEHVLQLMEHFLTAAERSYVLRAVHRK